MLNHSSGADACLLEVTEHIEGFKTSLPAQLDAGRPLSSYAKYLKFRNLLPQEELNVWNSAPVHWREEKQNVRRLAKKCKNCGAIQFPVRYKCWSCGASGSAVHFSSRVHGLPWPDAYRYVEEHS